MKLTNIKRINREELKDAPSWVDPMLGAYNNFMEQATRAINGNLTFSDNSLCAILTNTFASGVELVVKNPFQNALRPIGVIPIYADSNVLIGASRITYKPNTDIGITIDIVPPSVSLSLARTADQNIPDATNTQIIWNRSVKIQGESLAWSPPSSRITCVVPGNYLFSYTGAYVGNVTGIRAFWLSKNGTISGTNSRFAASTLINSGASNYNVSSSQIVSLLSGDYVELWTYQNSGGALQALGNATEEVQITAASIGSNPNNNYKIKYILIGG